MSQSQSYIAPHDYQHLCLHNALRVKITKDRDGSTEFHDVDHIRSNLFEKDSHSDRLLSHYLAFRTAIDGAEGLEGKAAGRRRRYCHCEEYMRHLQRERLHGVKPAVRSLRASLMKQV